jgi:hypothetical protein
LAAKATAARDLMVMDFLFLAEAVCEGGRIPAAPILAELVLPRMKPQRKIIADAARPVMRTFSTLLPARIQ